MKKEEVYAVRVKFVDGEILELKDVHEYGQLDGSEDYYISKNGYDIYLNGREIKYIGRIFDIDNKVLQPWER